MLLTGSVAMDDCVYGASDLDFVVLVEGRQNRLLVKRTLWLSSLAPIAPVHRIRRGAYSQRLFLDELIAIAMQLF